MGRDAHATLRALKPHVRQLDRDGCSHVSATDTHAERELQTKPLGSEHIWRSLR